MRMGCWVLLKGETKARLTERGAKENGVPRESEGEWVVLAGPWLCASPQLFMRQCTCQEPTDKHNSKAERKSNSASMGNAHNAPGETPLGPFLCCPLINRTRLPESCLILLKSRELPESSLFFPPPLTLFTCFSFGRDVQDVSMKKLSCPKCCLSPLLFAGIQHVYTDCSFT